MCLCAILFAIGKKFAEACQMLKQTYGEDCLSCTECYQCFKSGTASTEDDPDTGWPSTSTDDDHVEKVPAVICVAAMKFLMRLREAERWKRPEGWRNKARMLNNDSALAHMFLLIREFLAKHEMTVIPQLPYQIWPLQTSLCFQG
jgi:hypothetical protein